MYGDANEFSLLFDYKQLGDNRLKNKMFILILLSIVCGVTGGILFPTQMLEIRWVGELFINMLKLVVLPLVFSALVSAITSMGDLRRLGSVGIYTIGYVLLSVSFAVIIGIGLLNIFKPGLGVHPNLILAGGTVLPTEHKPLEFSTFLMSLFPPNIVDAAVKFEILPIVFFSIIFAIACVACGESTKPVIAFFAGLRNIFVKMITWLMYLTPIGLFALLGSAMAEAYESHNLRSSLSGMLAFIGVFLFGLFLQMLWQFILMTLLTRKDPRKFLRSTSQALTTAFGTSSSMATLPITLIVAKEQNIRDDIARFVLPFATTINLAGTAMYEAVSALFFCQVLGFHLSIYTQIGVFITAVIAGMGATGIPEGGLVTMVTVLRVVNIPITAISLLLPFDRILDRFRTMVNVWGDLICATVVDHLSSHQSKKIDENHQAHLSTVNVNDNKNLRTKTT